MNPMTPEDAPVHHRVYEFPATPTQRAMWFTYRTNPSGSAYNIPIAVRLTGFLDEASLLLAFTELSGRHEILRTVFAERSGSLVQVLTDDVLLDWRCTQVQPELDIDTHCRLRAASVAAEPFVLETGPLVRVCLERFSATDALLVMVFHHIVIDHLSLGQCVRELSALYGERVGARASELAEQELQFADYAVWLAEEQNAAETERKLLSWKKRLQGFSGALNLPADFPRPPLPSGRGAELRFSIAPELADAARRYARAAGVSLFTTTLAALKILLHRCSGQHDIVVGTPFANRGEEERLLNVVGCFINTLPIATDLSSINTFRDLVRSVNESTIEAFANQDVPFDAIVNAVRPHRDPGRNPLFQVGFVVQAPPVVLELEGVKAVEVQAHSGGAMYDLHVWLWDHEGGLAGVLWYNTDLFRQDSMERLQQRYQQVLRHAVESPDATIASLPLLLQDERERIAAWNATSVAHPEAPPFSRLFEASVLQQPEAPAITFNGATLTYAELNARANRLARRLQELGVRSGVCVAICLDRSLELAVALLGVQKSGGAYVPMDPDFPPQRLSYMLEDSGALVLIADAETGPGLKAGEAINVLQMGPEAAVPDSTDCVNLATAAQAEDPAVVIYTSGSTGRPKGVVISHRSLVNVLDSMRNAPGLAAGDVLAAVTTISFDIAAVEFYLPWLVHARIELIPRAVAMDGEALAARLASCAATVLQATPATWRMLVEADWRPPPGFKGLTGGEPLPRALADALLERLDQLWNLYGPTETTIYSTLDRVEAGPGPITIGRPIADTQVHVLDQGGQPVPIGTAGEIWIGGAGVALGYHRRPELTFERFVSDPFSPQPHARMYRTGDLGRWLDDGRIEHLGRLDNQVKMRGFRIELGEIEAVAAEHPAIGQIVVLAREFGVDDKRLVAYVKLEANASLTSTELRRHLRQTLPDYMIPTLLVELDALPLTPNGKIDRLRLPDPLSRATREQTLTPPRTDAEQRLAAIWCKALGRDAVGVDSNFFDLGGHSLLAMQVVFQIRAAFGVRLNPRDLILNSLGQLAAGLSPPAVPQSATAVGEKGPGLLSRILSSFGSG